MRLIFAVWFFSLFATLAASENIYRNNLKNRIYDKEALRNFRPERETIVREQGSSEDGNFEVKPTQSETDSSCCCGIEVFFSPEDHLAEQLIGRIEKEKESIAVAAYAFSHWKIAKALCEAKARGVKIEVVIDPFSLKFSSILKKLSRADIPIWVWDTSQATGAPPLMHDKFCLFGEKAVWTGSFNFTYYADRSNRENALFITDAEIAKQFKAHFEKLRDSGSKRFIQKVK